MTESGRASPEMYDLLVRLGVQPLVAGFIARPEWLHMASATLFSILLVGIAYLTRVDVEPYIRGRSQPFKATLERLVFWPAIAALLLWMYYYPWNWPENPPQGLYFNKFTFGGALLFAAIMGRAIVHFIYTEKNRWEFFDELPFYLMLQFQLAVPLVYYYALERNGLMPKEELGFVYACLFLAYFLVRILLGRPTHLPRNPVAPWVWAFLAYVLLTVIVFPYRLAAVKNVIQWVAFAACFLVGLAWIPDRRKRDVVLLMAVLASLISTLWGFWKYFDLPLKLFGISQGVYPEGHDLAGQPYFYKTPSAGRYFLLAGFFANPNYYGEYLIMVIYITLGLLFATDSRRLRIFLVVTLAINTFEMVAVYNRAGWLGGFVAAAFVLFGLVWARLPVLRRVSTAGLLGGLAMMIAVFALTGVIFNRRETDETPLKFTPLERLKSMTDFDDDETFRNRLTMWRSARMMLTDPAAFPERLIFGGGFGFFEVNYLVYQTKVLETYNFNEWFHNVIPTFRAHNDHLQMLVEAGLVGTILYALIFIMFFRHGFRFLRDEEEPARRFLALGIMAAVASLLAIAFFSFPLHQIEHGGLAFTAMALLIVEIAQRGRRRDEAAEAARTEAAQAAETKPSRKKAKKEPRTTAKEEPTYPPRYFITIRRSFPLYAAAPLIAIVLFLCVWGVYTQIINFKSQYLVVKGIATLRALDSVETESTRQQWAQIAADYFWRAYQLDPTNGRAEFFHGFALTKKGNYEDTVDGIRHLEEGQLLYPQSDTHYALAMGYESRRKLAIAKALAEVQTIRTLEAQLANQTDSAERAATERQIEEARQRQQQYEQDADYSMNRAIQAYMTAAQYYPVKIEYYKELLRLLEEQERYEEIIFWAERALVVDEWLLKKPPIRWQLYLWLGKAHRQLGVQSLQAGDETAALEHWRQAESAFNSSRAIANAYYAYYELGRIYEVMGLLAERNGDTNAATTWYTRARDMYVETFNRKDRTFGGEEAFDYSYYLLGRIYERLGDYARALKYYRLLLSDSNYDANSQTYQRARQRIHALAGTWEGEEFTGSLATRPGESEPSEWLLSHSNGQVSTG